MPVKRNVFAWWSGARKAFVEVVNFLGEESR